MTAHAHPIRFPAHRCGICEDERRRRQTYARAAVYLNGKLLDESPTVTVTESMVSDGDVYFMGKHVGRTSDSAEVIVSRIVKGK